jgi:hypothetical protein
LVNERVLLQCQAAVVEPQELVLATDLLEPVALTQEELVADALILRYVAALDDVVVMFPVQTSFALVGAAVLAGVGRGLLLAGHGSGSQEYLLCTYFREIILQHVTGALPMKLHKT